MGIGGFGKPSPLQLEKEPVGRLVLVAFHFGDDDGLFLFQLLWIEQGMEGHVAHNIYACLPVPCGHVCKIAGLVKARVGIEIAAQRLHFPGNLSLGTRSRALEDHVFEHMAYAKVPFLFVARTCAHIKPCAHHGKARVLYKVDIQAVCQFEDRFVRGRGFEAQASLLCRIFRGHCCFHGT